MFNLTSLFAGILFGFGLALSGMTHPEKVLGFLDVAGRWDPALIFVLGGAGWRDRSRISFCFAQGFAAACIKISFAASDKYRFGDWSVARFYSVSVGASAAIVPDRQ